jgi:hypothetical protein
MLDPVQLADPETVTLARCLGEPTHRSLLQRKLEHRGIRNTEALVALAVQRGCIQYQNNLEVPFIPEEELPNEKLAALLLSASQSYNPRLIRAGAQLLSDPTINLKMLVFEAAKERALLPLTHIARCGQEVEPDNPFWNRLLGKIEADPRNRSRKPISPGLLPHRSRFTLQMGYRAGSKCASTVWLRPMHKPAMP